MINPIKPQAHHLLEWPLKRLPRQGDTDEQEEEHICLHPQPAKNTLKHLIQPEVMEQIDERPMQKVDWQCSHSNDRPRELLHRH